MIDSLARKEEVALKMEQTTSMQVGRLGRWAGWLARCWAAAQGKAAAWGGRAGRQP